MRDANGGILNAALGIGTFCTHTLVHEVQCVTCVMGWMCNFISSWPWQRRAPCHFSACREVRHHSRLDVGLVVPLVGGSTPLGGERQGCSRLVPSTSRQRRLLSWRRGDLRSRATVEPVIESSDERSAAGERPSTRRGCVRCGALDVGAQRLLLHVGVVTPEPAHDLARAEWLTQHVDALVQPLPDRLAMPRHNGQGRRAARQTDGKAVR
jgi:hypothetical protein